jgi:hypothetical protein
MQKGRCKTRKCNVFGERKKSSQIIMMTFSELQFYMLFIFWRIGNMGVSKMKARDIVIPYGMENKLFYFLFLLFKAKGMQTTFASLEEKRKNSSVTNCHLFVWNKRYVTIFRSFRTSHTVLGSFKLSITL